MYGSEQAVVNKPAQRASHSVSAMSATSGPVGRPGSVRKVNAVADMDTSLVLRCQADDASAFNDIVARYKSKVFNYVARMVPNRTDAEDVTQETFVHAYLSIRSFQSRASLNTWLFRIATNLCIDHARRGKRTQALTPVQTADPNTDPDDQLNQPDVRYEPQGILMNAELGQQIDLALRHLPEKLRAVVVLHDIEDLPYEEIAKVVSCPVGTVKSRLFNARLALRKRLAPYLADVPVPPIDGTTYRRNEE